MRDEETGTWWQQVTGEAILGPLKGKHLKPVAQDELTFAVWKSEQPQGRVLKPDERVAAKGEYAPADWEEHVAKMPVATLVNDKSLEARTLVVGLVFNGASKAYPFDALQKQSPILDTLKGKPILVVLGEDKKSVRAFERTIEDAQGTRTLEFFAKPDASPLRLVDAETGSEWDFTGTAVGGRLQGKQLRKIETLSDYWFDWKTYHPDTTVYLLGNR